MKVKELIEELRKQPEDLEVIFNGGSHQFPVGSVVKVEISVGQIFSNHYHSDKSQIIKAVNLWPDLNSKL